MTVYVDEGHDWPEGMIAPAARRFGTNWAHMTTDGTADELHAFAVRLGLRRSWCSDITQPDVDVLHYDLVPSKRRLAIRHGAVPLTDEQLIDYFPRFLRTGRRNGRR